MTAETTFQLTPADDGKSVTFEVLVSGESKVAAVVPADQVQAIMDLLGAVRLALPGSVPEEPRVGETTATVNPSWRSLPFKLHNGRVLTLRHNGAGWVHFIFSDEEAAAIGEMLTADLPNAPLPDSTPSAAN